MKLFGSIRKKNKRDPTGTKSRARPLNSGNAHIAAVELLNKTPDFDRARQITKNPVDSVTTSNQNDSNTNSSNNDVLDAYEAQIEELGHLMLEQGRHLDELSSRSRALASENVMLREKVSSGLKIKPRSDSNKSPLKSIINQKKISHEDQAKMKEQNVLLHEQAERLALELSDANCQISDVDMTVANLEEELKASWENARRCESLGFYCF